MSETAAPKPPRRRKAKPSVAPAPAIAVAEHTAEAPRERTPLFVARIEVRWRDLDAFNHVNNSTFLTYLEEARLQWLRDVPGPWFDEHAMPVLAAVQLNYRRPIAWPAQLDVQLYVERTGNSSIALSHRIVDALVTDTLYCDGHVVMVWMDPDTGKPVLLPQAIRDAAG